MHTVLPPVGDASKTHGETILQFTVDSGGRVDPGSFSLLKTNDPLFAASTHDMLRKVEFTPAQKDGHAVGELLQMRFPP